MNQAVKVYPHQFSPINNPSTLVFLRDDKQIMRFGVKSKIGIDRLKTAWQSGLGQAEITDIIQTHKIRTYKI